MGANNAPLSDACRACRSWPPALPARPPGSPSAAAGSGLPAPQKRAPPTQAILFTLTGLKNHIMLLPTYRGNIDILSGLEGRFVLPLTESFELSRRST